MYYNKNILFFCTSNTSGESETLSIQHSINKIPLNILEERWFSAVKKKVALMVKRKEGNLTSKEEKWLDNKGNLIESLKDIKPHSQHILISCGTNSVTDAMHALTLYCIASSGQCRGPN
jgi:hypothetical protein